jgi:hypothetical protein
MRARTGANEILVLREYFSVSIQQRRMRVGTDFGKDHPKFESLKTITSTNTEINKELTQTEERSISDICAVADVTAATALRCDAVQSVELLKIEILVGA